MAIHLHFSVDTGTTPAAATASRSPAYLGNSDRFDPAILEFAKAYAEQNERDYNALTYAASCGSSRRAALPVRPH